MCAGAIFVMAMLSLTGCAGSLAHLWGGSAEENRGPVKMTVEESHVLVTTNQVRLEHGIRPLQPDSRLTEIARGRSRDMARRNYLSHETPEGSDVFAIMRMQRVTFELAAENLDRPVAPHGRLSELAMRDWLALPAQRANLLLATFGHVGIGIAVAKGGQHYLTQVFTD